jgi:anti-sigma B factor antagonist
MRNVDLDMRTDGDTAYVVAAGEIDLESSDRLRECCELALRAAPLTLRIDLFGVTFMDSTGLAVLVFIQNQADAAGKQMVLEDPQPHVRRVFAVTGLERIFQIDQSADSTR